MEQLASGTVRWGRWIFWAVFACTLIDRLILLLSFGVSHTGSDDVVFWMVAADMTQGVFREPFLYGQNYNPALESLVAVPMLWMSVPMHVAMPLSTSLLALLPYLSFALWHYRRAELPQAMAFATMPLLLPVEWGMMTMITRGFVTGLAPLALLPWLGAIRHPMVRSGAIGGTLYLALFINPNALLFVAAYFLCMCCMLHGLGPPCWPPVLPHCHCSSSISQRSGSILKSV